mmetsp:Transcript_2761/g.5698  ORF Transcript_2761/g.5698 Transcript_2761/m.5698 type:complete len:172 (+) Transcript_2761:40-555(+)
MPMLPLRILCLLGFHGLVKSAPVSITGTGAARIYLDDSEAGDADHLDASTLRTANIGAVLELKGSKAGLQIIDRPDGLRGARVAPELLESTLQEALGYIRKELAHGTGVLLNWKKNCDSGAVLAIAALIAEEGVDLDEAQKRVNGLHPCARKDETQTKLRQLFSQSSHSDL